MKSSFRRITIAILLGYFSSFGQSLPEPTTRTIQGVIMTEEDCPVTLSDARMEAIENQPPPHRSGIKQQQVTITNRSDQGIKRIGLAFIMESENGGVFIGFPTVDNLKAGESRTTTHKLIAQYLVPKVSETLKVRVTGVLFQDGTRWVPPRAPDLLLMSPLVHQRTAPLRITNCKDLENNHRLRLRANTDNIVAYRLGVLKDTPHEFAVNLGEWITLDASNAVKDKELEITASARQTGLSSQHIYKQDALTKYAWTGQPTKIYHGVAVFVAAVKFADGTIWQQDLRREFLIWEA